MATLIKVTFKRVNGDRTGVYARPKAGDLTSNRGILYMVNCPDGLTFYVNPNDEGNIPEKNWYRIENPSTYKLPDEVLYCRLQEKWCSWEEETIEDPTEEAEEEIEETPEEPKREYQLLTKTDFNASDFINPSYNDVWRQGNKSYRANSLQMQRYFSSQYNPYSNYKKR